MTHRFLTDIKKLGYSYWRVEVWSSFSKKKTDLFNMWDYLVICPNKYLVGIQITSKSNMSARRKKMRANKYLNEWLSTGNKGYIFGYEKGKRGGTFEELCEPIGENL